MPSGRGVHAVRIVRDRNVARVGRPLAAVEHGHAVHFLEVALLDRLLDPLEVEDDDPVLLVGGHLGQGDAFLPVVAGREGVFALIVGIDVVEIAADDHLPGHLHRVAVQRREDRTILARLVENLTVVRQRHAVFTVTEYVSGARILLQPQAVDRMLVRQFDDLVALHDVEPHPRHAAVGLVVHEGVAAVVGAVRERDVRVVEVAVHERVATVLEEFAGRRLHPFGQHLQAFVGLAPAGGAAAVEHRNTHQFAHRRKADDSHLAGLAAREEHVVFVELAWRHFGLQHRRSRRRCLRRCRLRLSIGGRDETSAVPGHHRSAGKSDARSRSRGPQQSASAYALSVFVVAHSSLLGFQVSGDVAAPTGDRLTGLPPAVMTVFGPLPPLRIEGEDRAWRFSRFSRTWIMCGQRWSSK